MRAHRRDAETEHLHQAVQLHHDLGWLKRLVNYVVDLRMIERMANLAGDILQIPDRESVFSGEGSCNRITLNVLGGSQKLIALIADAVKHSNVVAVEWLGLV